MNSKKFSEAMNEIDDNFIDEAIRYKRKSKKYSLAKRGILAACLALVLIFGILMVIPKEKIALSNNSVGVTVKYTNVPFNFGSSSGSLIYLSEEELFTEYDTAIFKGTITALDNIVMDFNGTKTYRAIAQIEINKVYRGYCKENETVSVLLPCSIAFGYQVEDTDIVTKMKVGMTGIFMPMIYDETSKREENGAILMLKDIADYGFADGSRYAFLETKNGLVFSKSAYESITDVKTLEQVEDYVMKMLERITH